MKKMAFVFAVLAVLTGLLVCVACDSNVSGGGKIPALALRNKCSKGDRCNWEMGCRITISFVSCIACWEVVLAGSFFGFFILLTI